MNTKKYSVSKGKIKQRGRQRGRDRDRDREGDTEREIFCNGNLCDTTKIGMICG